MQHDTTRDNTSTTRHNTSEHESNTRQHEYISSDLKLVTRKLLSECKLLKDFFTCELFSENKFQRGNQLVQKKKGKKEGWKKYFYKRKLNSQNYNCTKGRKKLQGLRSYSNNYEDIIL